MKFLQLNPDYPADEYWDMELIKWVCSQTDSEGVVIIPGAYQTNYINEINAELHKMPYCLVIVTSDEENKFPVDKLQHKNMKIWMQYPTDQTVDRYIPIGYAPNPPKCADKTIEYFYAGQINNPSRMQLKQQTEKMEGVFMYSPGFTQGYPKEEYNKLMSHSKIVPCPPGWISPDSFRLYEALEAGCTPVVDDYEFFTKLLGDFPFPHVNQWSELDGVEYKDFRSWWSDFKEQMVKNMEDDLWALR